MGNEDVEALGDATPHLFILPLSHAKGPVHEVGAPGGAENLQPFHFHEFILQIDQPILTVSERSPGSAWVVFEEEVVVPSDDHFMLVGEGAKPFTCSLYLREGALVGEVTCMQQKIPVWDGDLNGVVVCVRNANYLQSVGPFLRQLRWRYGRGAGIRTPIAGFKVPRLTFRRLP